MGYRALTVELPLGPFGLHGSRNIATIRPEYLIEARNVQYFNGLLEKELGASRFNATPLSGSPTILGGWDHSTNALVQRMLVATSAGTLLKDSGSTTFPVTLKSGLSASMRPYFVAGGKETAAGSRKTFVFTGTDIVQVLADDGATTSNLATPPADWSGANQPVVGANHVGRLWGAGNFNDPHRCYYSATASHEDFTGAGSGSISVAPGEGERIVGLMPFHGLLVVWKFPRGIWFIDTSSPTASNWGVREVTTAVGGVSPHAQVMVDQDIVFMDATGSIQSLQAVQEFGSVGGRNLSELAGIDTLMRQTLNTSRLPWVQGAYYLANREVSFCFAAIGATVNNRRLVLDLNQATPRYRLTDRDTCNAMWMFRDVNGVNRLLIGDNAGTVWRLDQGLYSRGGAAYLGQFQTSPTDLSFADAGLAHKTKEGEFLELVYEPLGSYNLTIDVIWDGVTTDTVTYTMEPVGAVIGSFIIGTSQVGAGSLRNQRKPIKGHGKRVSLLGRNNGINEGFSLAQAFLSCQVTDE